MIADLTWIMSHIYISCQLVKISYSFMCFRYSPIVRFYCVKIIYFNLKITVLTEAFIVSAIGAVKGREPEVKRWKRGSHPCDQQTLKIKYSMGWSEVKLSWNRIWGYPDGLPTLYSCVGSLWITSHRDATLWIIGSWNTLHIGGTSFYPVRI